MTRFLLAACALALIAAMCLLSGCAAREDDTNAIEVERPDVGAEYVTVAVRRGDVTLTETVRVTYYAARAETYGFAETGVYYQNFNVGVGDEACAGEVLAMLDTAELDSQISALAQRRESLLLAVERAQALMSAWDERDAGRGGDRSRRREYEVAARDSLNEIAVIDVQLSELEQARTKRVITSAIDGTVTYIRPVEPGETSVNGRKMITVTDLSACVFMSTVEHPEALDYNTIYSIPCGGVVYEARLATAEELGIADVPLNEKSTRTRVYFRLLTPSVELNENSNGRFVVTVAVSPDALYVPAQAVVEIGGARAVYIKDEFGLRSVRYVETGLETPRFIEVTSGLSEGDLIITN